MGTVGYLELVAVTTCVDPSTGELIEEGRSFTASDTAGQSLIDIGAAKLAGSEPEPEPEPTPESEQDG